MEKKLDEKRVFEIPNATIISFAEEDIIVTSGDVDENPFWGGSGWND